MQATSSSGGISLFLCGDVMTGRGIDQILPHPGMPRLLEPWVKSALRYVRLAERESGAIERPVNFAYVWGDALAALRRNAPGNWDFTVAPAQRHFAHALVDAAGADVVYGHSSHHVKGIEIYRGKPILYGCGDFLNDYEGIGGHEEYRGDLALMYFPTLAEGRLTRLAMTPTQTRHLRVNAAPPSGVRWLADTLNREGKPLGTRVTQSSPHELLLQWQ